VACGGGEGAGASCGGAGGQGEVGSKNKTEPGKETGQMEDLSNEFAENDKAKF
jgi:hypothetical protein